MFKKISSLLLCGLISFSLIGMQNPSEDGNDLHFTIIVPVAGPPPAPVAPIAIAPAPVPTTFEKLKGKLKASLRDLRDIVPAIPVGLTAFGAGTIIGTGMAVGKRPMSGITLLCSLCIGFSGAILGVYSESHLNNSRIRDKDVEALSFMSGFALGGFAGLCTGIKLANLLQK